MRLENINKNERHAIPCPCVVTWDVEGSSTVKGVTISTKSGVMLLKVRSDYGSIEVLQEAGPTMKTAYRGGFKILGQLVVVGTYQSRHTAESKTKSARYESVGYRDDDDVLDAKYPMVVEEVKVEEGEYGQLD